MCVIREYIHTKNFYSKIVLQFNCYRFTEWIYSVEDLDGFLLKNPL